MRSFGLLLVFLLGTGLATDAGAAEPCPVELRAPILVPAAGAVTVNSAWVQDFDVDGLPDVLGVRVLEDNMKHAVLAKGLGGGAFDTIVGPILGERFNDVRLRAADLDGDGTMDLVAGSSATVDFLRGLGSFQFEPAGELSFIRSVTWSLADIDGDGSQDLIASATDSVQVYRNEGTFTFAEPREISIPSFESGVLTADLNADGRVEVVAGVRDGIAVLDGAEDFARSVFLPSPGRESHFVADLDGDGLPEVIAQGDSYRTLTIHRNLGTLAFATARTVDLPAHSGGLDAGDLDADGSIEIVLGDEQGLMVVASPLADEPIVVRRDLGFHSVSAVVADMDGDGHVDVFARTAEGAEIGAILFRGLPPRDPVTVRDFHDPRGAAVADFDRDGRQDLAIAIHGTQAVRIWRGAGGGTFAQPFDVGTTGDPRGLAAADLDADGWVDLAVSTNGAFVGVAVLRNLRGRGFERLPLLDQFTEPEALAASDIDGDGAQDLALRHRFAGASVLFNDGDGSFPVRRALDGANGGGVVIADVDGDGLKDVLVPSFPGVYIHFGQEGRLFSRQLVPSTETMACAAGDLTGDGVPDLVIAHAGSDSRVGFFEGLGSRRFGLAWEVRYPDLRDPVGVVLGDLDGNAWTDFVLVRDDSNFVTVFLNRGSGEFGERRYACRGRTLSAVIGDLDGNHRDDVVVVAAFSATVVENVSPCAASLRGDVDLDRRLIITDGIGILRYLILKEPLECVEAADADANGDISVADTVTILRYLFLGEMMARDPVVCRG